MLPISYLLKNIRMCYIWLWINSLKEIKIKNFSMLIREYAKAGSNFLKAVFQKFYPVHSWILSPILNPFQPKDSFLHPLRTSENQRLSTVLRAYGIGGLKKVNHDTLRKYRVNEVKLFFCCILFSIKRYLKDL